MQPLQEPSPSTPGDGSEGTFDWRRVAGAFALVALAAAYIIFLFNRPDLMQQPLVQVVTAVILAVCAAGILFTLLPGRLTIGKAGLSAAGAVAFVILALPQLIEWLRPTNTINGILFKGTPAKRGPALGNVNVLVPNPGGRPFVEKTRDDGSFLISGVPNPDAKVYLVLASGEPVPTIKSTVVGENFYYADTEGPEGVQSEVPLAVSWENPIQIDAGYTIKGDATIQVPPGTKADEAVVKVVLQRTGKITRVLSDPSADNLPVSDDEFRKVFRVTSATIPIKLTAYIESASAVTPKDLVSTVILRSAP